MVIKPHIRPFKVRFEIAKSTFSDYESFIRSFARNTQLQIREFYETEYRYVFDNDWTAELNRASQIELRSPVLDNQNAGEVTRVVDALQTMNVKIGETCRAYLQYERLLDKLGVSKLLEKVPLEFWCGFWLVVFLVLKTVEFQIQEVLTLRNNILFQILGYLCVTCFSICFYRAFFSRLPSSLRPLRTARESDSQIVEFSREPNVQELSARSRPDQTSPWRGLAREIRTPLENVMAYTRFYQGTVRTDSQHAKDLAELAEQAIRIQEILNRLESDPKQPYRSAEEASSLDNQNSFRRTPRVLELIPMVVKGQDPLGQEFETPSYTLNTSSSGACLLLPDRIVKAGQKIILSNHRSTAEAEVRWVIQGKTESMVFAGVQFIVPASYLNAEALRA